MGSIFAAGLLRFPDENVSTTEALLRGQDRHQLRPFMIVIDSTWALAHRDKREAMPIHRFAYGLPLVKVSARKVVISFQERSSARLL